MTSEVTIRALRKRYGAHADTILEEYLKELPRRRGTMRRFRVLKDLPAVDEFEKLRAEQFTSTVAGPVDDAFSVITDLACELTDWYEGLPEAFQDSKKGNQLSEASEVLEGLTRLVVPDGIGKFSVFYLPPEQIYSRADQRGNAVGMLQAVVDVLREKTDPSRKARRGGVTNSSKPATESLINALEDVMGEVEDVTFPRCTGNEIRSRVLLLLSSGSTIQQSRRPQLQPERGESRQSPAGTTSLPARPLLLGVAGDALKAQGAQAATACPEGYALPQHEHVGPLQHTPHACGVARPCTRLPRSAEGPARDWPPHRGGDAINPIRAFLDPSDRPRPLSRLARRTGDTGLA